MYKTMTRKIITIDVGDMSPRDAENLLRELRGYPPIEGGWVRELFETLGIAASFGTFL